MDILAHRANKNGPVAASENTVGAVWDCLEKGWGIETDIRMSKDGKFYISHDAAPATADNDAIPFFRLFEEFPKGVIALNLKELGYEKKLLEFVSQFKVLDRLFLFDMELIEKEKGKTTALLHQLNPKVKLAARTSDRKEPVEDAVSNKSAAYVWIDEFDTLWVNEDHIKKLKGAGKKVYAISPELHGFKEYEMLMRWDQFQEWGVDGICTDYPQKLSQQLTHEVNQ